MVFPEVGFGLHPDPFSPFPHRVAGIVKGEVKIQAHPDFLHEIGKSVVFLGYCPFYHLEQ